MDISFSTNSGSFCGNATIQSPGSYDSLKSSSKNSICRVSLFESVPFKLIFAKTSAWYGFDLEYFFSLADLIDSLITDSL
ncbi:Uncharacterised protein [Staphylococcus aureus]|nr:Uncharacterised protein [Staphylococcus aureus]CAC7597284.1 Uncharacterised protein [Staphylococcus aureus]